VIGRRRAIGAAICGIGRSIARSTAFASSQILLHLSVALQFFGAINARSFGG